MPTGVVNFQQINAATITSFLSSTTPYLFRFMQTDVLTENSTMLETQNTNPMHLVIRINVIWGPLDKTVKCQVGPMIPDETFEISVQYFCQSYLMNLFD